MSSLKYGIIGSGRMSTHMQNFFDLKGINYITWSRKGSKNISLLDLEKCDVLIILITDSNIEEFVTNLPIQLKNKILVHFSGALYLENTIGFHPLMTFGSNLYSLEEYDKIPFIGDSKESVFREIFPNMDNFYYTIPPDKKPLYHALCVMGGNFTTILWQQVLNSIESDLNLPKEVMFPYMEQVVRNLQSDYKNALTGPIKRDDKVTIKKNIKALNEPLLKRLYRIFKALYAKSNFAGGNK